MNAYEKALKDVFEKGAERRLSLPEEIEAIADAKKGGEAGTLALIYAYAPTLRNSVRRYKFSGSVWGDAATIATMDADDARSMAIIGLLEAVAAFDPERHERLAGIVSGYVSDSLSRGMSSMLPISVPPRTSKRFFAILAKAEGDVEKAREIAPSCSMARDTFDAVLAAVRNVEGLDLAPGDEEDGPAMIDLAKPIWDTEEQAENRILVEVAFDAVDDLEEKVCRIAYGFEDYDPQPDAEVAHRVGLSRQKAQRVRAKALSKMREALQEPVA